MAEEGIVLDEISSSTPLVSGKNNENNIGNVFLKKKIFFVLSPGGGKVELSEEGGNILYKSDQNNINKYVNIDDIVGVSLKSDCTIIIHAYPQKSPKTSCCNNNPKAGKGTRTIPLQRYHVEYKFTWSNINEICNTRRNNNTTAEEVHALCQKWIRHVRIKLGKRWSNEKGKNGDIYQNILYKNYNNNNANSTDNQNAPSPPSCRLLCILNPFSGTKIGVKTFRSKILPVFQHANIQVEEIVTRRAGHATDIGRTFDPTLYDGVVLGGGDGILYEFLQGVHDRKTNGEDTANTNNENSQRAKDLPFGILPLGTGNGLSASILLENNEHYDPITAAFGLFLDLNITRIE